MRVLLDTHVLLWWFKNDSRISSRAASSLSDQKNTILISAAAAWEIAIKVRLGKMEVGPLVPDLNRYLQEEGFLELPVNIMHAMRVGSLPLHHRDPFDRLLIAQAQVENIPIMTADAGFDRYDVTVIW